MQHIPVMLQLCFEATSLQDLASFFINQMAQMVLDVLYEAHMLPLTALLLSCD